MNKNLMIWVSDNSDAGDLIKSAGIAIENSANSVSAPPEYINMLWSWLEDKPVDIYARENFDDISVLAMRAAQDFKRGANGIQIDLKPEKLSEFVSETMQIKNDLFFDKKLLLGFNLADKMCIRDSISAIAT